MTVLKVELLDINFPFCILFLPHKKSFCNSGKLTTELLLSQPMLKSLLNETL